MHSQRQKRKEPGDRLQKIKYDFSHFVLLYLTKLFKNFTTFVRYRQILTKILYQHV